MVHLWRWNTSRRVPSRIDRWLVVLRSMLSTNSCRRVCSGVRCRLLLRVRFGLLVLKLLRVGGHTSVGLLRTGCFRLLFDSISWILRWLRYLWLLLLIDEVDHLHRILSSACSRLALPLWLNLFAGVLRVHVVARVGLAHCIGWVHGVVSVANRWRHFMRVAVR